MASTASNKLVIHCYPFSQKYEGSKKMKHYNLMSKMVILLLVVLSLNGCGTLSPAPTPAPSICPQDGAWKTNEGIPDLSFTVSKCEITDWTLRTFGQAFYSDPSITIPIKDGQFSIDKVPGVNFSINGTLSSTTQAGVTLKTMQGETINWNASPVGK